MPTSMGMRGYYVEKWKNELKAIFIPKSKEEIKEEEDK